MQISQFIHRTSLKSMAAAALLALSARYGAAQNPGQIQPILPPRPEGPAIVTTPALQTQAPAQLTPQAPPPAGSDAAMRALMLDVIKQHEADKKKEDDLKKKVADDQKRAEGSVVGADTALQASWDNGGLRLKVPTTRSTYI